MLSCEDKGVRIKPQLMDPLSVSASIITLLQSVCSAVSVLRSIKHSSNERRRLLLELSSLRGVLEALKELNDENSIEDDPKWTATAASLMEPDGLLNQCKSLIALLISKLQPGKGVERISTAVAWPFQSADIKSLLATLERYKQSFSLALVCDHL